MSATSSIEWTDKTWNPVRGCSVISPGCVNCYAMKTAHRFSGAGGPYEGLTKQTSAGPQWTGIVRPVESALLEPLSWRKPARVFVNSMSDLFHDDVPDEFIDRVFAVMAWTPWHTFQILTKRPQRMGAYFAAEWYQRVAAVYIAMREGAPRRTLIALEDSKQRAQGLAFGSLTCGEHSRRFLPNVWLGVSVENQHFADERIPLLLQTPAAVRFISAEPLLGLVNLRDWLKMFRNDHVSDPTGVAYNSLDWVIVGGESGPGARQFDLAWARSLVEECRVAGVPVFVKQLGSKPMTYALGDISPLSKLTSRKGGDPTEWPADLNVREFPVSERISDV